jgi:acetyl-CoA C-acetyltransferase
VSAQIDPRHPVLVGAGQLTRRPGDDGDAPDPLTLMERAATLALADSGAAEALRSRIASVAVVDAISWPVGDPGALLAQRLGITPAETMRSGLGGNGPQAMVNDLGARMARGELDAAVIAGAEAMATLMPYAKRGERPDWPTQDGGAAASRVLAPDRAGSSADEIAAGLIAPIMVYPLIEHAVRGAAGRGRAEPRRAIAALWARFSEVAGGNEHAWTREALSAAQLATPSEANRPVSDPYLKLLNANITVDMGAALVLCSAQAARDAGVPADRWVFLHAGAGAADHWHVSERDELHRSPAIRAMGAAALGHAGVGIDDVAHLDLYSCFPSAVQVAAAELGVALDDPARAPTVTGGLTFAGGPGNNYVTHSIATLAGRLREDPEAFGVATALGWYVTKHAIGVYSAQPPARGFAAIGVQDQVDALPSRAVAAGHHGAGEVESFTALYERDGSAGMGIVAVRLPDGRRALAKSHDAAVLAELLDGEDPLGRRVELRGAEAFALS